MLHQRVQAFSLDRAHFTGSRWNAGKTADQHPSIMQAVLKSSLTDEQVFRKDSLYPPSKLSKRLKRMGWSYQCKECGLTEWCGKQITLHVDHIDGNTSNNELVNLRFLCPNCHQQTPTWGSKNMLP